MVEEQQPDEAICPKCHEPGGVSLARLEDPEISPDALRFCSRCGRGSVLLNWRETNNLLPPGEHQ